MTRNIKETTVVGAGRRKDEVVFNPSSPKPKDLAIAEVQPTQYKLAAGPPESIYFTAAYAHRPRGSYEIWHPEARPGWYWDLVRKAAKGAAVSGDALSRVNDAFARVLTALSDQFGIKATLLTEWEKEHLFVLDARTLPKVTALTSDVRLYTKEADAPTVFNAVTNPQFLTRLRVGESSALKQVDDWLNKLKNPQQAIAQYAHNPAATRAGRVLARKDFADFTNHELVLDPADTERTWAHLLAHEFAHAHSGPRPKSLCSGLQDASGKQAWGLGADEAVTETLGRAVTDVVHAAQNHLMLDTRQQCDVLCDAVRYNYYGTDGGNPDQVKGGLRYGFQVSWLVQEIGSDTAAAKDLLKAYFTV